MTEMEAMEEAVFELHHHASRLVAAKEAAAALDQLESILSDGASDRIRDAMDVIADEVRGREGSMDLILETTASLSQRMAAARQEWAAREARLTQEITTLKASLSMPPSVTVALDDPKPVDEPKPVTQSRAVSVNSERYPSSLGPVPW